MISANDMLTTNEAAVVSAVPLRTVNRIIDQHILPDALVSREGGRRISADACVYISFFERTAEQLTPLARKRAISSAVANVKAWRLSKGSKPPAKPWVVWEDSVGVDLTPFASSAAERYRLLEAARKAVVSDPDILGGEPVLRGTRVPVHMIAGYVAAGDTVEELLEHYPTLDADKIALAVVYAEANPQQGRPKTFRDRHPEIEVTKRRVYALPSREG
jgi:uncharacterized protein (DUF433 family)